MHIVETVNIVNTKTEFSFFFLRFIGIFRFSQYQCRFWFRFFKYRDIRFWFWLLTRLY